MFGVVASSYNIFVTITGWDEPTATELPLWIQTVVLLFGGVLFGWPLIRQYAWLARQQHWYGRLVYGILPLLILPAFPLIKAARINSSSANVPSVMVNWKELLILEILLWVPILLYEAVKRDMFTILYTKSKNCPFLWRKEP
ncbi:hypothetical protein KDI_52410 [Dictyobacter arantiisoli]|uniref:Uncharacterized protein n=2 Tax=Dictyobacter arantiisoli TaxID=2014874 RepID=A0A5A5TJR6_9CHLR|nr:hypothetical protein KDI_52410 [Dictyobacter arantiisoli]